MSSVVLVSNANVKYSRSSVAHFLISQSSVTAFAELCSV